MKFEIKEGFDSVIRFENDTEYIKHFSDRIRPNTLLDENKLLSLYKKLKEIQPLEGEIVEVGVWRGGSARLLCENAPSSIVFLIDTFEGLPAPKEKDNFHVERDFDDTSIKHVLTILNGLNNYNIISGRFPLTTSNNILKKFNYKLVHIDVDLYQEYLNCINFFYPRMIPGGYIIFDDYEANICLGARLAVDEFVNLHNLELVKENNHSFIKIK